MIQSYVSFWKNYAVFSGRSRRRDYWWVALVTAIISGILSPFSVTYDLSSSFPIPQFTIFYWILLLYGLATLIPSLALTWRRLHDIGKSGGWFFISLVPIVGGIWLLILLCTDSAPDNEYGPNPKA